MEKDSNLQLELFGDGSKAQPNETLRVDNPLVNFIRACEKKAWGAVAFIVVGVIAFSVGVERGRRMGLHIAAVKAAATTGAKPVAKHVAKPVAKPIAKPVAKPAAVKANQAGPVKGSYTIQLGTYGTRAYAEQEVLQLKKKGFPAVMVKDGKHTLVCVGKFENKEAAQQYAARLKGMYKSCLIRRF